jgi:type I restriction enzyme S subunit
VSSEEKKYKVTHLGDLCYNPANLKFGVICLNTFGDAIFSPIYVTFEISSVANRDFVGACLMRPDFINKALRFQQGTVYERMAVSPEDLLSMTIHLPRKSEQDKLSQVLKKVDERIANEEKQLTALSTMKTTLLRAMFI